MKILISLAVFVVALVFGSAALSAQSEYLSYDDFIRAAEVGHIKSVTLDRFSSISGTQLVDGVEKPFASYAATGTANDPLLLRFLKEKSVLVTVDGKPERRHWAEWSTAVLMLGIPVITLIFVILIYRRIRRAPPEKTS